MNQDTESSLDKQDKYLSHVVLDSMLARLDKLENPEQTIISRIQNKASFIALLIGIVLSLISLFDIFWTKPNESLFKDLDEFNKAVNAVSALRISAMQNQQKSPEAALATASLVMPQILTHINYAAKLLPKIGDNAGVPQLIVLVYESMNVYDWKNAQLFVDRAVAAGDATPAMKSEALRYQARLESSTGRIAEARKSYLASLNALSTETAYGINGSRAYVISDWITFEYVAGDCTLGDEKIKHFFDLLNSQQVTLDAKKNLIAALRQTMIQVNAQNRCPQSTSIKSLIESKN